MIQWCRKAFPNDVHETVCQHTCMRDPAADSLEDALLVESLHVVPVVNLKSTI